MTYDVGNSGPGLGQAPIEQNQTISLAEQELLTLPEHLSSPTYLVGFVLLDL